MNEAPRYATREEVELLLIDEAIAKLDAIDNFHVFARLAWHVIEPDVPFVDSWHIGAIGEHLNAVVELQIRNLLINIPPRMMKSTLVSVLFPAWVWLRHPWKKFLYSSYAANLSVRDSIKCRRLIESDWYQSFFKPAWTMNKDQNKQDEFSNTRSGHRIATSVDGGSTGKGGDIIVCDDPHKATEVYSPTKREAVLEWWDFEMSTRSIDPKTVSKIIVMQRLHEKDLSGHVLEKGGYEHLKLPMEFTGERKVTSIGWSDPRTEIGELLSPKRFGLDEINQLKRDLGAHGYAGQEQQEPKSLDGGVIKRAWFKYYKPEALPWNQTNHVSAWDFATSEKTSADATCGAAACRIGAPVYLLDMVHGRWEFTQACQEFKNFHAKHPKVLKKKVENKSAGIQVIQTLKSIVPGIVGVDPKNDKLSRLIAVSPFVEAGNVYLPEGAPWVQDFLLEVCGFAGEGSGHDDRVDVFVMLLQEFAATPQFVAPTSVASNVGQGY